jgi:hypothetical protein
MTAGVRAHHGDDGGDERHTFGGSFRVCPDAIPMTAAGCAVGAVGRFRVPFENLRARMPAITPRGARESVTIVANPAGGSGRRNRFEDAGAEKKPVPGALRVPRLVEFTPNGRRRDPLEHAV